MLFSAIRYRLRQTLIRNNLLSRNAGILIAISGGQDSLALAEALRHLHAIDPWKALELAHCDHKWPADQGNPQHVTRHAENIGLPLHIIPADIAIPLSESAAREWRYSSLAALAEKRGLTHVVTAHTATDLAETVLFNLSNGCGAEGLSSLSWSRALTPTLTLVRPFLNVTRTETATLCRERRLPIWHDVYNNDLRYARNRIRSTVVPALREALHLRVEENLARSAHLLREDASCLRLITETVMEHAIDTSTYHQSRPRVLINRRVLLDEHIAIQRRVIRMTLQRYTGLEHRNATFAQVEAVCQLLNAPVGTSSSSLSRNVQAHVTHDDAIAIDIFMDTNAFRDNSKMQPHKQV